MAFNLADVLGTAAAEYQDNTLVNLDLSLIDEDDRNFYAMTGIDDLAANIELVGLMDPIRVRRGEHGRYIVVSGHRRRAACMKLRDEGNDKFKTVPCIIESAGSEAMQELRLIFANNSTRVISGPDMQKQVARVTWLLYRLKEEGVEFPGRMSEHVAQACQISTSRLKRLNAIKNNLIAEFYACFESGTLNETAAYALSRLPVEVQEGLVRKQKVMNMAQKKGGISGMMVDEAIKYADKYKAFKPCLKDGGATCPHHIERYAATICNQSYDGCDGKCCVTCAKLDRCSYPCRHGKVQLAAQKAEEKAEKDARDAKAEEERRFCVGLRRIRHFAQICRLADLAERAGLDDGLNLSTSWALITVGALKEMAEKGIGDIPNFYSEDYTLLNGSLSMLEDLAKQLHCTVGELAGEEPVKESAVDTKNKWQACEDFSGAEGWYLMRHKNGIPEAFYYRGDGRFYWDRDDEWGSELNEFTGWAKCPED